KKRSKKNLQMWYRDFNLTPNTPAHIDWYEAESYCNWLSEIIKQPFSLPTEAQWEYAARSRGQFFSVATNTGKAEVEHHNGGRNIGINIATSFDRELYSRKMGTKLGSSSNLPGDAFPPNSLGVYDMSANGYEWIKDWYDPDYYKHSPLKNPQGPDSPAYKYKDDRYQKVVRSSDRYNGIVGSVVDRAFRHPKITEEDYFLGDMTARCVVNSPVPVSQ
nr:SUMF1/EgtB/PvdO family nonheme iron enzyme [Cronobacter turicensis]